MKLRAYQDDLFRQVVKSDKNLLIQLDTGAGKTPIIAKLAEHYGRVAIVCHRNILVKQASEKLAMCGVEHAIMAAKNTKKICANNNIDKTGRHWLSPRSSVVLVSVDTFNSKMKAGKKTLDASLDWVVLIDEAHHFAEDNKWQALQEHLDCRTIGFTATPTRGDGQPMVREFGGFFDDIIQASGYETDATEKLIAEGFLSEYTAYFCEPARVLVDESKGFASGMYFDDPLFDVDVNKDYSSTQLQVGYGLLEALMGRESLYQPLTMTGIDKKIKGRQTLIIFPRIEVATAFCNMAKSSSVSAETIHSKKPQYEIERILTAFEQKKIRVLAAVDMVNEGFDLPGIEVLVLCRDIRSFGFYRQVCGRVLRPAKNKHAVILDIAGSNIPRHGLPSDHVDWHQKQATQTRKYVQICPACLAYIKQELLKCNKCGEPLPDGGIVRGTEAKMELKEYTARLKQQLRRRLAERERAKRQKKLAEKAEKEHQTKYINHKHSFPNTLVGERCALFFRVLKKELKHLNCSDYNDFFMKNKGSFSKIEFYIGYFTADFKKHQHAQCIALYEAKK